ncbi:hypothetical protein GH810_11155 [Acetobacterium paludosum]|uniref:Glycosyltransferase n=1 Tax=Acetobacterium paludosum TaxID=52693 RepID=A0A923HV53_9FIRM|nr:glycosyltransferase family 4 protein [Acetobacterium paludosum]MBC3888871.1 hypothetical protein [Acetobacterium paludosum]
MKVLIKLQRFAGGAPRSLLQYARALSDKGINIIAAGEAVPSDAIAENYKKNEIAIYYLNRFNNRKVLHNILLLFQLYKLIMKEKPDSIITTDGLDATFCSMLGKYFNMGVIIIRAGGPDPFSDTLLSTWNDNQLVVFSEENREYYIKHHYNPNKIRLISNRIEVSRDKNYENFYRLLENNEQTLSLLVISRLDKSKMNSILTMYKIIENLANEINNIQLIVAGSGDCSEFLSNEANKINQKFNGELIKLVGHVDNIQELILKSHLVFGKGRSVIEPIMMNRIGIVVGEDNEFSLCTGKSFENLYSYNFSGRNIIHRSGVDEIQQIIMDLRDGNYDYNNLINVADLVCLNYESIYLTDKLLPLIEQKSIEKRCYKLIKLRITGKIVALNIKLVFDYIRRRL